MKVAILSFYSGHTERGVETWAENLKAHLPGIQIISGFESYNPFSWKNFDVIIPTNGRFQVLIARLFCKKVIVFGHSGPGADDKWNLWCSPNVFVAFSNPQAVWVNKFKLPWTKVVIIPHAVDTKIFVPMFTKKIVDVLCVAANNPNKRVKLVRLAVKNLRVAGTGQLDQVPFKKMPQVYNQARVFCFVPQPWEAFGLVFLEAMACNLPIVTIDDPIRKEIVGNAGILVKNPENISELSAAVEEALKSDWGNKPRQQAEKFSWAKTTPRYVSLFQSLV